MTAPRELVWIGSDDLEVEVLPSIGARLHRLRAFGRDLLRTPDELTRHVDDPWFWGSYPMAPWCNRLPVGPATLAGRRIDLPVTFPDGTSIHGQVARTPWTITRAGSFRVEAGGDGWPWRYAVEQDIAVIAGTLTVALRLTNLSDDPMPGGLGIHPWFRKPVEVAIAAKAVHPSNLATEAQPVAVSGRFDRRHLSPLPDDIDAAWTTIDEPPVTLAWPEAGIRATMTGGRAAPFIVAAAPADVDAVAVEPETHAPDGARRLTLGEPGGLTLIDPGESLGLTVTLRFERAAGDDQT